MPKQKDLKRLVRSRMQKTGESYTTARAQLVRKTPSSEPRPALEPAPPPDYATLAGMSDDAVHKATGRSWSEWIEILDAVDAASLPHREIARHVEREHGIGGWWAQSVTVGYERIRGLREVGQRRGGSYDANKSKTFAVPVARLYRAFSVARIRRRWLPEVELTVRTAHPDKSMRITWPDGSRVSVYFNAKGDAKSQVAIQHAGLASRDDVARRKAFWAERLAALAATVS